MAGEMHCMIVARDRNNLAALQFYFSRRPTDAEMQYLHEVMQRAVAILPLRGKV